MIGFLEELPKQHLQSKLITMWWWHNTEWGLATSSDLKNTLLWFKVKTKTWKPINPYVHEMGPQGPKHYIFVYHFYSNAWKLGILPKVDQIHKRLWPFTNLVRSPGTHDWNKIHNILWIQSTSSKMMISYVF